MNLSKHTMTMVAAAFGLATLFSACNKDDMKIEVSNITLNQTAINLAVGGTFDLTATVLPENAADKSVMWASSNTSVATVENGKVTAMSVGTADITAKAGEKTATCKVQVTQTTTETQYYTVMFSINGGSGSMPPVQFEVGKTETLPACTFTRDNHIFAGWAVESTGIKQYDDQQNVIDIALANGSITLYALWQKVAEAYPQETVSNMNNVSEQVFTELEPFTTYCSNEGIDYTTYYDLNYYIVNPNKLCNSFIFNKIV